jgi:hypothetical protein
VAVVLLMCVLLFVVVRVMVMAVEAIQPFGHGLAALKPFLTIAMRQPQPRQAFEGR